MNIQQLISKLQEHRELIHDYWMLAQVRQSPPHSKNLNKNFWYAVLSGGLFVKMGKYIIEKYKYGYIMSNRSRITVR